MKIANISKLVLSLTLALSTLSFTHAEDKKDEKTKAKVASFGASLYRVAKTSKVKLAIDKIPDANVNILLKDSRGQIMYQEVMRKNGVDLYRRVFDLEGMEDGTYYFVLMGDNTKITKTLEISSSNNIVLSL